MWFDGSDKLVEGFQLVTIGNRNIDLFLSPQSELDLIFLYLINTPLIFIQLPKLRSSDNQELTFKDTKVLSAKNFSDGGKPLVNMR